MAVFNSYMAAQFAGKQGFPDVWISFEPHRTYSHGYAVHRPGVMTDPVRIHNGGTRLFNGPRNSDALQKAMDWAKEQYGVEEWVKIPGFGGDYFPKGAAKAITAERKRRLADK